MNEYQKNSFRKEVIDRYGVTVNLPLFESVNPTLTKKLQSRFENAPKSIATARSTKRLARKLKLINAAELSKEQQEVYNAFIRLGASTNKEISVALAIDASTISARNNELRTFGKLTAAGKRVCKITGMVVTQWKAL